MASRMTIGDENVPDDNATPGQPVDIAQLLAPIRAVRALRLSTLLDFIQQLSTREPITYSALFLQLRTGPVRTGSGALLSNSAYYHILEAAILLGAVGHAGRGKPYVLTQSGRVLARLGRDTGRVLDIAGTKPSDEEGDYLRNLVVGSPAVNASFFRLFRGRDDRVALESGRAVEIAIVPRTIDDEQPKSSSSRKQRRTLFSQFYPPLALGTAETQAVIWGVRQWCLDLGILDELVTSARQSVSERAVQVLFPIARPSPIRDFEDFDHRFIPHFWSLSSHNANYWSASVPELLRRLCPMEHLAVVEAKDWMAEWLEVNRSWAFGTLFSPSTAMPLWTRKSGDYDTLLRGYLRLSRGYISHIGILDQALSEGRIRRPETELTRMRPLRY
jgi:hypothetical protein